MIVHVNGLPKALLIAEGRQLLRMRIVVDSLVFQFGVDRVKDAFDWWDWLEANPTTPPRWRRKSTG